MPRRTKDEKTLYFVINKMLYFVRWSVLARMVVVASLDDLALHSTLSSKGDVLDVTLRLSICL